MEGATDSSTSDAVPAASASPNLPRSEARHAPHFERRDVQINLVRRQARTNARSMRRYAYMLVGLTAVSVGGWFGFEAYIYG